jgi:hypothetical protein
MKVKELIEMLKKQDPEKQVMIQQGEVNDYMAVYSVKEMELTDMDDIDDDAIIEAVVIEYT